MENERCAKMDHHNLPHTDNDNILSFPPFLHRLTSMRKTSSHGEGGGVGGAGAGQQEQAGSERGTLHTKRHSGDHHDLPRERYSPL